jgi:hypothetical protein
MDFNLDGFFSVENIISAIFNGAPLVPDPQGTQMLAPTQSSQGSQDVVVTLPSTTTPTSTSTLNSTSICSPGKRDRSGSSPPSLSTQSGDDAHKQARPGDTAPPPKLDETSSVYTDDSCLLLLPPGKLHTSSYDL